MKESRVIIAVALTLVVACAKNDKAAADSAAAAAAPPPSAGPAPVKLADFAGKWQMRSIPTSGKDTTPTTYTLMASADSMWDITFASGQKIQVHATASGDSVMLKSSVYPSQRRKGVKVMTEGSARMQGGKMVGMTTAHYQGQKDSVLVLRVEGTKIP